MARNCEPLTPDDIAESIVFVAGQRENVVIAVSVHEQYRRVRH